MRPCSTSVPRITQKTLNRITGRSVNGSPELVVVGSASAAASETAPRIPIHAMIAIMRAFARPVDPGA